MQEILKKVFSASNLKFFLVALINFIITLYTSHIVFDKVPDFNDQKYLIIKILAFIILVIFWQIVPRIIKKIKEKNEKTITFLKYFSIYFGVMLLFLFLTWPGIWRFDEFFIFYSVKQLAYASWQHWLTSAFYIFCLYFIPFPVSIVLFQLLFISLVVAYIVSEFQLIFKTKHALLLLIPFLFPSFIDSNLYPFKYTIYSYVELLLFSSIIFKYLDKKEINYKNIFYWGTLISLVSSWRAEAEFFIIAIPILLIILFHKVITKKQIISLMLIISICTGFIIAIQNNEIGKDKYKYALTGIMTPLSNILKTDFKSDNKAKDIQVINRVIDVESLIQVGGVQTFYKDGKVHNITRENMNELIKVYLKLIFYNFPAFARERMQSFVESQNLIIANNVDAFVTQAYIPAEFTNKPINSKLRLKTINTLECKKNNDYKQPNFLYNLFYNPVIPFCFLSFIFLMGIFRKNKLMIFIPLLILIQTALTICTIPNPMFMYYFPLYVCGYVFSLMLILAVFVKDKRQC